MERRTDLYCIDWDWAVSHAVGIMDLSLTVHQQQELHSFFLSVSFCCRAIYSLCAHLPPSSLFLCSHFCLFFLCSKSQLCTLPHTNTFTHTHASAFSSIEWLYCHYCLAGTISPKQFMKWQLSNTNQCLIHHFLGDDYLIWKHEQSGRTQWTTVLITRAAINT